MLTEPLTPAKRHSFVLHFTPSKHSQIYSCEMSHCTRKYEGSRLLSPSFDKELRSLFHRRNDGEARFNNCVAKAPQKRGGERDLSDPK